MTTTNAAQPTPHTTKIVDRMVDLIQPYKRKHREKVENHHKHSHALQVAVPLPRIVCKHWGQCSAKEKAARPLVINRAISLIDPGGADQNGAI